ncbi:MAG: tRNA preQ1(34) S-adenosylmethionine ribosyltransferase-isomerase QueA [Patescibacteria group bacterium]
MTPHLPLKNKLTSLHNYNYNLPFELIAQKPVRPRDHSRLLVLDKKNQTIGHYKFYDIIDYLNPGDVLVFNNTKVIPARLHGQKITGGKLEVFLLNKITNQIWTCLIKGKIKIDQEIFFSKKFKGKIVSKNNELYKIVFNKKNITSIGETPTPPYIKPKSNLKEYQTVYAKHEGSVAAPTAGFHFTKALLKKLKAKGVQLEYITLHVGLGTFQPVKEQDITKHKMHSELATINKSTAIRLQKAKKQNRRIIAVGTTTVRTLESLKLQAGSKWTDIFIYPGYKFNCVDAMITNFHLPQSTLLMLISAFSDSALVKKAYHEAVAKKYRFYSFGDAMFIYK